MATQQDFLAAIYAGDLQATLPFSDWLEEQGRPRQAMLLRRRYQRWQSERRTAERTTELYKTSVERELQALQQKVQLNDGRARAADYSFRRYVSKRFGPIR